MNNKQKENDGIELSNPNGNIIKKIKSQRFHSNFSPSIYRACLSNFVTLIQDSLNHKLAIEMRKSEQDREQIHTWRGLTQSNDKTKLNERNVNDEIENIYLGSIAYIACHWQIKQILHTWATTELALLLGCFDYNFIVLRMHIFMNWKCIKNNFFPISFSRQTADDILSKTNRIRCTLMTLEFVQVNRMYEY